ncbi:MAG TPA: DUF5906 domain-containing protein, partial [Parasulfuritortus sp.]
MSETIISQPIKKSIATIDSIVNKYITFGDLTDITKDNVLEINKILENYSKEHPDDSVKLIDTSIYLDFGYDFANQSEQDKFTRYLKEYSKYKFVNMNGKPVVVKEFNDNELLRYEFSSVNDFNIFHSQDKFDVIDGKKVITKYFSKEWIQNEQMRKRFGTTTFDPSNSNSSDVFNYWRGFVKPIKGNYQPFIDHINKIIKGTQEEKDYIVKLLAYSVRFPEKLTETALAFRGNQGAGKTTISETMRAICPYHSSVIDDLDSLFSFNAETIHTKYFLMEESVWGGEKSKSGPLKNLITSKTRKISIKNIT